MPADRNGTATMEIAVVLLICLLVAGVSHAQLPRLVEDDFENGLLRWKFSDPQGAKPTWKIIDASEQANGNRVLRCLGGSQYEPPHRSPLNFALIRDTVVGDFELTCRVQSTNYDAGDHRDLCLFWGYQDPAHFYYVHLGARSDPNSCQIFIVNAADRTPITEKKSAGIPWDRGWQAVKVVRDSARGSTEVFFGDMRDPVMTARDTTFTWGRVGVGTFDDHGNFDDVCLRGVKVEPIPAAARLP